MMQAARTLPETPVIPDSFTLDDLLSNEQTEHKLKPPAISRDKLGCLKQKLKCQEGLNCHLMRAMQRVLMGLSNLGTCLFGDPVVSFFETCNLAGYSFWSSSTVDNISSGRDRMMRMRPAHLKNSRDLLKTNHVYTPCD